MRERNGMGIRGSLEESVSGRETGCGETKDIHSLCMLWGRVATSWRERHKVHEKEKREKVVVAL